MNTRFYNAKILVFDAENHFSIAEDELHVTGDTITYIGPGRKADPDAAETTVFDREIDARGNLLIPGFKNAHTHTPMTFLRSYADDLPLHEWLERQVFPNEAKLAGDDVYWLNILGIMEYLTSGITSNFDMYIQQKNSIAATVDTGFRTVLTSGLNNFVDSPEILEEMYNYVNKLSDRTSYLLGFHAEYTTGGPLLESVAKLAEKYHSPVWTHNAETKSEVEGCKERWGLTPTQLMERLGMFQYGGGGYHCIWMEDRDFEIFRDRKLTAVTNPSSNLKLASGICPLKRFYDNGINLAIGTDGPASNNCLDMFREMFLTTGLSKVREMDAAGIPADAILYMATAGGAHAIGLSNYEREHVEAVRAVATVAPHVLQVESHPFFPNADLRTYAQGLGMVFEAWSPLARGRAVTDPTLIEIGAQLGVGPTQVALRWALDRGHVVFPKTLSRERMAANFDVFSFSLDPEQTARIDALDAGEAGRMGSHPATMDRL